MAIHEPKSPSLLQMVLPLGLKSLPILHGLLALSVRSTERSSQDLQHYQLALKELREELQAARFGMMDMYHVHELLALSLLLSIFSLPRCDGSWVQHHRGMLSVIRSTDQSALASTALGRFLMSLCAFQDISALALGRKQPSRKAWLSWMLPRTKQRSEVALTALEATIGYPETLIDIVAQISEFSDDNYHNYLDSYLLSSSGHAPSPSLTTSSGDDYELALKEWPIPSLPEDMSSFQELAVRLAWESLRKASLLFLWRNCGFHANLMDPIRADRRSRASDYIAEILTNIRAIVDLDRCHRFSVGTAMLWPITVIGCECRSTSQRQRDQIMQLLNDMARHYPLDHVDNLRDILARLWRGLLLPTTKYLSLEQVCIEMDLVVPLF